MRVLAIDPGYDRLGMAVVEGNPSKPTLVWSDCVKPAKGARELRLARVYQETTQALKQYRPDLLAIEALFFSTNVKTALGVAEARGAILAAAGGARIPVVAFTASVTSTDRSQISAAGFDGFLSKPINLKEFLETVKRLLESRPA